MTCNPTIYVPRHLDLDNCNVFRSTQVATTVNFHEKFLHNLELFHSYTPLVSRQNFVRLQVEYIEHRTASLPCLLEVVKIHSCYTIFKHPSVAKLLPSLPCRRGKTLRKTFPERGTQCTWTLLGINHFIRFLYILLDKLVFHHIMKVAQFIFFVLFNS